MFSQKKPYTAVTVTIERLTSEIVAEDDISGIPDLVEIVNLQDSGPTEAARAIRKKLKYGNTYRQLRALTLLDGLIQNAGPRFQRTFADEPLLDRLRFCGTAEVSDPEVKKKCAELFRSWASQYKSTRGMEQVSNLYKELPKRKHVVTQEKSRVIKETENPFGEEESDEPQSHTSGSKSPTNSQLASPRSSMKLGTQVTGQVQSFSFIGKEKDKNPSDKKAKKHKAFNLDAEKEQMKAQIAEASIAATNLMNTLQSINREKERISENQLAVQRFEACKQLRRRILRYIHHVESEQWLGSLLHANDELVTALMTFEQLDRSIDADSDSDDDVAEQAHLYRLAQERVKGKVRGSPTSPTAPVAGLKSMNVGSSTSPQPLRPVAPPRPSAISKPSHLSLSARPEFHTDDEDENEDEDKEENENDPFADSNAVVTPYAEKCEPTW